MELDHLIRKKEDWIALRFEAGQTFTPSTPIAVAELFSGRKKEVGQLIEAIAERGRHAIVYGERGVGKTSLSQVVPLMLPRTFAGFITSEGRRIPQTVSPQSGEKSFATSGW